ncbi:tRNA (adenosine(37)-N6)-threonylcarbamoyltransferase complex ATPase subunit type 1 TsaE [Wenyingzhuangia sp. 1_MG-2023]|nr:tRNA (adenosine(37)-N6)-threonylcarbamoyltransferase complex ATPase subunit type 1 TsaE [Wenyingzhuangia sp. 1_MG-2023]
MEITYSLDNLPVVASQILEHTKSKILLFYATMGTGKTTLIKELANQLGCNISSSPTFSLVNEYETPEQEILYHFDFYRIDNDEEAYDIGTEEYFYNNQWCFVEWPENIENLLPLDAQVISIKTNSDDTRTLCLK